MVALVAAGASSRARRRTSSSSRAPASRTPRRASRTCEKLGAWLGEHPEAGPAIQAAVSAPPPASYAQCTYNGIHAFRWVNADGEGRFVRYRWEPEAGVDGALGRGGRARSAPTTCRRRSSARRPRGAGGFRLVVTLAEDGDPVDDPTAPWPDERETRRGRSPRADRARRPSASGRRRAGVRPHARGRRDRAVRGPDPALPARAPTRSRSSGAAASRSPEPVDRPETPATESRPYRLGLREAARPGSLL